MLNDFYAAYYKALHKIHVFEGEDWTPSIGYTTDAYKKLNPSANNVPNTWADAVTANVKESDNGGTNSVKIPPTASTSIQPLDYYDTNDNNKVRTGTGGNEFSAIYEWPDGTYYFVNVDIYAVPKVKLTIPGTQRTVTNGELTDTITQTDSSATVDISQYLTSVTGYNGKTDTAKASTPVITYTPSDGGNAQTVANVDSSKAGTYTVSWTALDPTSDQPLAAGDAPSTPGKFSDATATGKLILTVAPNQAGTTTTKTTYSIKAPTLGSYFIYNTPWDDPQPTITKTVTTTDSDGNTTTASDDYTPQPGEVKEVFNSQNNAPAWDTAKDDKIDHSGSYVIDYIFTPTGSTDTYTTSADLKVGNHAFFQAKSNFPKVLPKGTDLTQFITSDNFLATNYDNSNIPITSSDNQTVILADGSAITVPHATVKIDPSSDMTASGNYQTVVFDLFDPNTGNPIYKGDGSRSQWTISLKINDLAELDVQNVPNSLSLGQAFDPAKYITKAVSYNGTTDLSKDVTAVILDSHGEQVSAAEMTKNPGTYSLTYNLMETDDNGNSVAVTDYNNNPITAGPYTITVTNSAATFALPFAGGQGYRNLLLVVAIALGLSFIIFISVRVKPKD